MRVVEPVLTIEALEHEVVLHVLRAFLIRILFLSGGAMAINIKEILVILVEFIYFSHLWV